MSSDLPQRRACPPNVCVLPARRAGLGTLLSRSVSRWSNKVANGGEHATWVPSSPVHGPSQGPLHPGTSAERPCKLLTPTVLAFPPQSPRPHSHMGLWHEGKRTQHWCCAAWAGCAMAVKMPTAQSAASCSCCTLLSTLGPWSPWTVSQWVDSAPFQLHAALLSRGHTREPWGTQQLWAGPAGITLACAQRGTCGSDMPWCLIGAPHACQCEAAQVLVTPLFQGQEPPQKQHCQQVHWQSEPHAPTPPTPPALRPLSYILSDSRNAMKLPHLPGSSWMPSGHH